MNGRACEIQSTYPGNGPKILLKLKPELGKYLNLSDYLILRTECLANYLAVNNNE